MEASLQKDTMVLHLKRMRADGTIIPCTFTIQKVSGLILMEDCQAPAALPAGVTRQVNLVIGNETIQLSHDRFMMYNRVLMKDAPIPHPALQPIRDRYFEGLQQLGPDCAACDEGALIRQAYAAIHATKLL
jgi:hypothetical protein